MNNNNLYILPQDFVNELCIESGDTLLIASNVEQLAWNCMQSGVVFDFNCLINLLQEKVGQNGNILFPTYNWDFCKGIAWDYYKTKSKTGSLSQLALKRNDFVRTKHPIYSFAVWGKDADILYQMNDSNSFAGDTPFHYLCHKEKSKMLTIDVNLTNCFTFVHYVEEVDNVPYRFLKNFTAPYIDENHNESTRTYSMYVRYLDRTVITDFTGLEKNLLEQGKMILQNIAGVIVRTLRFDDVFEMVDKDIRNGIYHNIVRLD